MARKRANNRTLERNPALRGIRVVNVSVNAPGPAAAAGLAALGARVVKIEPPDGDPLRRFCPAWYRELHRGQRIVSLNLKTEDGRRRLDRLLAESDLLLTAQRPSALNRLGLAWERLHRKFPALCQVALLGFRAPRENVPGHDLTYQAEAGLLAPPHMPRTLWLDLASAERMVSAALGLLLSRNRAGKGVYAEVAIADTAQEFSVPLRYGLTARTGVLGGGAAQYNLYSASDGWIALAALEPHFWDRLRKELNVKGRSRARLAAVFRARTTKQWERWAAARDLPLAAVRRLAGRRPRGARL